VTVPIGEPQTSAQEGAQDPAHLSVPVAPPRFARFTGRRSRRATYAVLVAIGVELGLIGAFLSLQVLHVLGVAVPVGPVVGVGANLGTGLWAVRLTGNRTAVVAPAVGWLAVVLLLSSSRSEGDLVITNSGRGVAFLLLGVLAWAVAAAAASRLRGQLGGRTQPS
jgi:Family of unknown function (DUF6113)